MSTTPSYRLPNLVIGTRVALAFAAVGLMSQAHPLVIGAGVSLIGVVLLMDGLDGYVARRFGATSRFGALLDITADRIVEHIFWIFFAVAHVVGLWAPLVVMTRSFVVDTARSMALTHGQTAFGSSTMMRSPFTQFLTGSRLVRTVYGAAKAAAFVLLGAVLVVNGAASEGVMHELAAIGDPLTVMARITVVIAVGLCVVRGIPVLWDSRAYLFSNGADGPNDTEDGTA